MKQIKAILTDLDGTLQDSTDSICAALHDSFINVGVLPPSKQSILNMFGLPVEVMLTELTGVSPDDKAKIDEFLAEYKRQYPIHMEHAGLIDGAEAAMRHFAAQGCPICLITSERQKNVNHVLKKYGMQDVLRYVITRDDVTHFKPHPEPLLKGAQKMGVMPEDCAYIGESPFDMQAGKAAGVYTIGVPSGCWSLQSLIDCRPDRIIDRIGDLKNAIYYHL